MSRFIIVATHPNQLSWGLDFFTVAFAAGPVEKVSYSLLLLRVESRQNQLREGSR